MLLHFYSDSVITDTGFMAEYTAIRKQFKVKLLFYPNEPSPFVLNKIEEWEGKEHFMNWNKVQYF